MTNNFYSITEAEDNFGRCLILKAPWSDDLINIIKKENISVLRLTESAGGNEKAVTFLEKLKGIGLRGVEIYAWGVKDITPLHHLHDLERVAVQCEFTKAPDFSSFTQLTHLFLSWRPQAKSVFDCLGLQRLNITGYPAKDLKDLKNMSGVRRLQITSRKLISLEGVESLQLLRTLDLAGCPNLQSLSGIEKCQEVQIVEVENCKKINDISSFGELTNLREVLLTDCGKIRSLKPLVKCEQLESLLFVGDTNVEDGDLTPLLDMPKLKRMWFADKRHYSHKREQVEVMLS